jgi:Phage integrase, N-terminal SAM-like domain
MIPSRHNRRRWRAARRWLTCSTSPSPVFCGSTSPANGDASIDTLRGHRSQLATWVAWCADHGVDARTATPDDLKLYREDLVAIGRQPTTIAHKLNVLRRVYAAAGCATSWTATCARRR